MESLLNTVAEILSLQMLAMSAVSPDSAPHPPSAAGSASAPLSLTFVKLVTSLTCLSVSRVVARSHNSIMPQIGKGEEGEGSERGKDGRRRGGKASHHSGRQTKFSRGSKLENCFFPPHGPSERVSPTTKHSGIMGLMWAMNSKYGVCLRKGYFRFVVFLKKGQCGALSPFSASLFPPSFASILLPPFE